MRHMWVSFETTYVLQPETYKKDLCESAGDLQKRAVKRELYTSKKRHAKETCKHAKKTSKETYIH